MSSQQVLSDLVEAPPRDVMHIIMTDSDVTTHAHLYEY
jgi:hypothetical protein